MNFGEIKVKESRIRGIFTRFGVLNVRSRYEFRKNRRADKYNNTEGKSH